MWFLTLLKGFSLKAWGFIALGLAVTALATKFLFWLDDRKEAYEFEKSQVVQLNKALSAEREQRREAEVERDTTQRLLSQQAANLEAQLALLESIEAEQRETLIRVDEMKDIFDRHDFTELTNAKPTLIIKRVNRGTQDVLDKVQDAINSN